jgi:hypothetical protein
MVSEVQYIAAQLGDNSFAERQRLAWTARFHKYPDFASHRQYSFMPYLDFFDGMYCLN